MQELPNLDLPLLELSLGRGESKASNIITPRLLLKSLSSLNRAHFVL